MRLFEIIIVIMQMARETIKRFLERAAWDAVSLAKKNKKNVKPSKLTRTSTRLASVSKKNNGGYL